jgi:type I restriction enzyme S subunit
MGSRQVALPPLQEQMAIVAFLQSRSTELDLLSSHAEAAITLLQERRAALISAAVTGKIDVRNLATAAAEAA